MFITYMKIKADLWELENSLVNLHFWEDNAMTDMFCKAVSYYCEVTSKCKWVILYAALIKL